MISRMRTIAPGMYMDFPSSISAVSRSKRRVSRAGYARAVPRFVAALALALAVAVVASVAAALVLARDEGGDAYRGSEPPGGLALPHFSLRDERGVRVDSDSLR